MSANAIQTLGVGENGNKTLKQNENSGFFRSPRDHRGESRFFTFGAFVLVHRTKPSYRNQSLGGRALISWAAQGFLHLLSFSTVALGKEFPDLNYRVSTPLMMIQRSIKTTRKKRSTSLSMIKWLFCPFSVQIGCHCASCDDMMRHPILVRFILLKLLLIIRFLTWTKYGIWNSVLWLKQHQLIAQFKWKRGLVLNVKMTQSVISGLGVPFID